MSWEANADSYPAIAPYDRNRLTAHREGQTYGLTMMTMALNLRNTDVDRLAAEVARLTGESKTEAIVKALEERRRRLLPTTERRSRLLDLLRGSVWPCVPKGQLGRRLTKAEENATLGYGREGV